MPVTGKMIPICVRTQIIPYLLPSDIDILMGIGLHEDIESVFRMIIYDSDKDTAMDRCLKESSLTEIYILLLNSPYDMERVSSTLYTASVEGGYPICRYIEDTYDIRSLNDFCLRSSHHDLSKMCIKRALRYGDYDLVHLLAGNYPTKIRSYDEIDDAIVSGYYRYTGNLMALLERNPYSKNAVSLAIAKFSDDDLESYRYAVNIPPLENKSGDIHLAYAIENRSHRIARYLRSSGFTCLGDDEEIHHIRI